MITGEQPQRTLEQQLKELRKMMKGRKNNRARNNRNKKFSMPFLANFVKNCLLLF